MTTSEWSAKVRSSCGLGIPQSAVLSQRAVAQTCSIGLKAMPNDCIGMLREGEELIAGFGIPHLRRLDRHSQVATRNPSSGTEGDAQDLIIVTKEGEEFAAGRRSHIFAVLSALAVATRNPSGLKATPNDRVGMLREGKELHGRP